MKWKCVTLPLAYAPCLLPTLLTQTIVLSKGCSVPLHCAGPVKLQGCLRTLAASTVIDIPKGASFLPECWERLESKHTRLKQDDVPQGEDGDVMVAPGCAQNPCGANTVGVLSGGLLCCTGYTVPGSYSCV